MGRERKAVGARLQGPDHTRLYRFNDTLESWRNPVSEAALARYVTGVISEWAEGIIEEYPPDMAVYLLREDMRSLKALIQILEDDLG